MLAKCQKLAESCGGKCLTTEFTRSQKMKWQCVKGHIWETLYQTIANGYWCRICSYETRRTSISECQKLAESRGGKCLSLENKGSKFKLEWMCENNHTWQAKLSNIKQGTWCPICSRLSADKAHRIPISECQKLAESRGGKCLSLENKGKKFKLDWMCENNHTWQSKLGDIKKGTWCPLCAKTSLLDCQQIAELKEGKCLSAEYKGIMEKVKWMCKEGHIWETTLNTVKNGKCWCPYCAQCVSLGLEKCKEIAQQRGGECLSTEYKNINTKMLWKCKKGHTWEARFNNIKNYGGWCPYCQWMRSEESCRKIFETLYNFRFPKARPKFLKGLELDGFNNDYQIAFEYQGKQHYEFIPYFHQTVEKFEKLVQRDKIKKKLCEKHNISLIYIPYKFTYNTVEQMEQYIREQLSLFNLLPPTLIFID